MHTGSGLDLLTYLKTGSSLLFQFFSLTQRRGVEGNQGFHGLCSDKGILKK